VNEKDYVVKIGSDTYNDVLAYELLEKEKVRIPIPKIHTHFPTEESYVVVMNKVPYPLLDDLRGKQYQPFIPSMIYNLQKIHQVTRDHIGLLKDGETERTWREELLFRYSGTHPWFPWEEIMKRRVLDAKLIDRTIHQLRERILRISLPENNYSLLHTDFNQKNLFCDPQTNEITGIIDWSEAMFGDPLYDFSRVRIFISHFDLGDESLETYYELTEMTDEEKLREDLYVQCQLVDYLNWYSEDERNPDQGRIALHQKLLKGFL
jgi:aminoglycoside phosphotransferase (APT) family kinase protein